MTPDLKELERLARQGADIHSEGMPEYALSVGCLSLIQELEQARKDAERYRWLQPALISGGALDDDHTLTKAFQHMTTIPTKEEFNAAIDAAIAKEQTK